MLSSAYDPKPVEAKIYSEWEKSGYFNPDNLPISKIKNSKIENYIVYMPLPNVTGTLHMGHALDNTGPDILIRYLRMKGYKTLWLPGTDHAGIATQYVVEKELKKEGKNRWELGREKFIERVWEWKNKYGDLITEQLKKLGISADWSRTRFTMDEAYNRDVLNAFVHYYKKGWLYQSLRTVNWCPRCGTSLSELELEYSDEKTTLYYMKYGPFTLATTRPETKFGDTALAVNPRDRRYQKYVGQTLEVDSLSTEGGLEKPGLKKIKLTIVADEAVDMEFGTGVVKVTPAHDLTDFEIAERHNLAMIQVIDERGKMKEVVGKYAGVKTTEIRKKIVEDMKATGLLVKEEPYDHHIARCYRCNTVIEPVPSKQWFLKMQKLAKMAIEAVKSKKVSIQPKNFEKTYFNWLLNIRDWTVSRQIWWGHQLPVYYDLAETKNAGGVLIFGDGLMNIDESFEKQIRNSAQRDYLGTEYDNDNSEKKMIIACSFDQASFLVKEKKLSWEELKKRITHIETKNCEKPIVETNRKMKDSEIQDPNVLDTWFSSALWPFAGLSEETLKKYYPGNLVSNAREILNLWDARMIFSGLEFMGKVPFKNVLVHGTVLTKEGKRMSKSLGTGIDPLKYIEEYGADVTRFAVIWQATGQDIHWDETAIVAGRKFCNKIWNASRFVLSQIGNSKFEIRNSKITGKTAADKKILEALRKTQKSVFKDIENFEFSKALHDIYDFFWHEFCDIYLETAKKQIMEEKTVATTKKILGTVLFESLKLIHPFLPFITEEIYQKLPLTEKKLLMIETL